MPGLIDTHIADFKNPLGDDLQFRSLRAKDSLGRLYRYEFELVSKKRDIDLKKLLGQPMMLCLQNGDRDERYFHGIVSEFATVRSEEKGDVHIAIVVPSLWLLTRTRDSRIFMDKKVPDIVEELCKELGVEVESKLSGSYPPLEYCVQYRETDFDFVSRLMEQHGIYYFFKHEKFKHTLVLADDSAAHGPAAGWDTVNFFPPANEGRREEDHLSGWACRKRSPAPCRSSASWSADGSATASAREPSSWVVSCSSRSD